MKHSASYCIVIVMTLFFVGCPQEKTEGPCEVDCASLEYCGQPACEVCPSLCNEPEPSSSIDAGSTQPPSTDAGQHELPVTDAGPNESPIFDAGPNDLPISDAGSNEPNPPITTDAGQASQSFNCEAINNIRKSWGGSSGPCGPHDLVTINNDGTVTVSEEDAYPPEGAIECAAPVVSLYTVNAETASTLITLVCNDYATNYIPSTAGCVGAYENFNLRQDDTLVAIADISCGNTSMSASELAFIDFMMALAPQADDAGIPSQDADGGQ